MMRRAKQMLADNWLNAAIATLIYYAIYTAASFTGFGQIILYGPMTFGYVLYLGCLGDTRRSDFNLLFRGFNRFMETLIAGLLYVLIVLAGSILLLIPGIIASLGLALTFYIMLDDPYISGTDAIQLSWNLMKGHKWDLFCLWLRFLGWALLCLLTCGIGYLFLMPYMYLAMLNFYRKIRYGSF